MWDLIKLALVGGITLSLLQNANPSSAGNPSSVSAAPAPRESVDTAPTVATAQAVGTVHGICAEDEPKTTTEAGQCTTIADRKIKSGEPAGARRSFSYSERRKLRTSCF
jgi:hypothetical protein